jgi:hypothetical protein
MSAAAQITDEVAAAPALHVAEGPSLHEIQAKEMNRWMLWFGAPALVMAIFMSIALAGGGLWAIGGVLTALIVDICVLIWLCMSSDTNGAHVHAPAAAH